MPTRQQFEVFDDEGETQVRLAVECDGSITVEIDDGKYVLERNITARRETGVDDA